MKKTETNKQLVMRILKKHGGRNTKEILQISGNQLTLNQVKGALKDLKESDQVYLRCGSYYPSASIYETYVTRRAWTSNFLMEATA